MSALLSFAVTMAVAVVVFVVVVVTGTPLKVPGSNTTQGYSTLISKEEVLGAQTGLNGTDIDHYLTLQEYSEFMKEINSSYPNAEVVIYGKSYEGRDLMAVKFYRNSCNPTIFVEAGIHAREWIASTVTLKIINTIARNSSQDEEMSKLLDLYNWVFVPMVNPDGYDFSHHENRYWRKSRRIVTENCTGVDLNRNFDINWGTVDASNDPCSDTYCGKAPFSEPETQSLKTIIQASWPLIGYISLHAFAQLIICPYSYTKATPEDFEELVKLAENVTKAIYNTTGEQYLVGEGSRALYEASGCATDWVKKVLGVKYSYAIEMRPSENDTRGFSLPASEIEPTFRDIFIALKTFANGFRRNISYLRDSFKNCNNTKQAQKETDADRLKRQERRGDSRN